MPDIESGSHTQGYLLTQRRHVLGRGVHKAKNIDLVFCMIKFAVPSWRGYGTSVGASISGGCVRIKGWVCTYISPKQIIKIERDQCDQHTIVKVKCRFTF